MGMGIQPTPNIDMTEAVVNYQQQVEILKGQIQQLLEMQ